MIIVTGGAGFIGSNIVRGLNREGITDILVVDDLTSGRKFHNLVDCKILDYLDKEDFLNVISSNKSFNHKVDAVFHEGACTDTMEWNGRYMLQNNYSFSKTLFHYCIQNSIQFIYASSAAIYGMKRDFKECEENESPLNVYGYSKLLFDQYVRRFLPNPKSQIVGLRYFNVYGRNEQHKGSMASVMMHFNNQMLSSDKIKLFGGSHGFSDGEHIRDFVCVEDIVKVNLWFLNHNDKNGIYNVGTGKGHTFNEVADEVLLWHKKGAIEYIPFPKNLLDAYQCFTQAEIKSLRDIGYDGEFKTLKDGVKEYLDWMNSSSLNF